VLLKQCNGWGGKWILYPEGEARIAEMSGRQDGGPPVERRLDGLIAAVVQASAMQSGSDAEASRDLAAALKLLLRAEPSLVAEVQRLAQRDAPWRDTASLVLAQFGAKHDPITRQMMTLESGYIRPPGAKVET
jgi:hypothetical protein